MRRATRTHRQDGFSLIELVIVVVIIAIIGAIAIPRMSRGAAGASESALSGDLAVLRNAIDLYATEHQGDFPGDDGGTFNEQLFVDQLTQFTDLSGNVNSEKDNTHIYGPYLRKIPPLPVGDANQGSTGIVDATTVAAPGDNAGGWYYNMNTGNIRANTPVGATAEDGTPFNEF